MNDTRCIRTIKHRIKAIGAAYMVLARMLCAFWIAARPGDGSLASDASGGRLLGLWSAMMNIIRPSLGLGNNIN